MNLKCYLSVAYYIETWSYRGRLYFLYLSLCLRVAYICLIYLIYFAIIIFIFISINHIISLIQTNLFVGHVSNLRVLLSFWLIFYKFQPTVTYKSVACKKKACIRQVKFWNQFGNIFQWKSYHKLVNWFLKRSIDWFPYNKSFYWKLFPNRLL